MFVLGSSYGEAVSDELSMMFAWITAIVRPHNPHNVSMNLVDKNNMKAFVKRKRHTENYFTYLCHKKYLNK